MPSPFPGMNPFLEHPSVWPTVHSRLISALADAIAAQVAPAYSVEIGTHIYVHEWPQAVGMADVSVSLGDVNLQRGGGAVATATEPTTSRGLLRYPTAEEVHIEYLELRNSQDDQVVTVIELLSRSNKYSGPDRDLYIMKRTAVMLRTANLVEIDLLRAGPVMPNRNVPPSDYSVLVSRPERRPYGDYWAISIRDRLPNIPIPLRAGEPDAVVDLQEALDTVYDRLRFGTRIYRNRLEPALSPDDAEWAKAFIPVPAA